MTKLRNLIAAGIVLAGSAIAATQASAYTCYYEYYWDGWNYAYVWVCY